MTTQPQGKFLTIAGLAVIVAIVGYFVLTAPDQRNVGEKISDSINELPNGVDKAAQQLESRTPGEKIGDAMEDAGDDMKKATNQQ